MSEATPSVPSPIELGKCTNSIDIFIDPDGSVTFSDLPDDLLSLVASLSAHRTVDIACPLDTPPPSESERPLG